MKEQIEIVDRYSALGIERPNIDTMCGGQCEGTGYVPHYKGDSELQMERQEGDDELDKLWDIAHALPHREMEVVESCEYHKMKEHREEGRMDCKDCVLKCDGWHLLKCPTCNGTGKK